MVMDERTVMSIKFYVMCAWEVTVEKVVMENRGDMTQRPLMCEYEKEVHDIRK